MLAALQGKLSRAGTQPQQLARQTERFGAVAAAVSNLGRVEVPDVYGSLELRGLHAAAGPHLRGTGIGVVATTVRGRLSLNMLSERPLLSTERAGQRIDALLARLGGEDAWARSGPA